jgi:uncharacterized membrane protein YeaQ/YmgE (transglycosylase-associated protein family)
MEALIIQLISGAIGGNVAGRIFKDLSLGTLGNSLAGIVGGIGGSQILGALGLMATGGGLDIASIISSIASGGIGGGILLAVVGILKKAISNN